MASSRDHLKFTWVGSPDCVELHARRELHGRGVDWELTRNQWVMASKKPNPRPASDLLNPATDHRPLYDVIETLMEEDIGVIKFKVTSHVLYVYHSKAVTAEEIVAVVKRVVEQLARNS